MAATFAARDLAVRTPASAAVMGRGAVRRRRISPEAGGNNREASFSSVCLHRGNHLCARCAGAGGAVAHEPQSRDLFKLPGSADLG